MFYYQLKNELTKLFGKKRTYIGFGMFLVAQLIVIILFTKTPRMLLNSIRRSGFEPEEFISTLTIATLMVTFLASLLLPLYVSLVGGDIVSKEAEDGTLRMILCRPISRVRLLCVKWTAGLVFSCVLVFALGFFGLLFSSFWFPIKGGMFTMVPGQEFGFLDPVTGLRHYALAHVVMVGKATAIMSLAFMFSCFNMKPAAATILALSLILIDWILMQIPFFEDFRPWFLHHYLNAWELCLLERIPWWQMEQGVFVTFGFSLTVLIIGITAFQVRDIKS